MPTRLLLRLLPTLVAGLVAVVGLGAPAQADSGDEATLAEKYAPVLMLVTQDGACGPGEPYRPSDVDVMFDNPTIALRGPWVPQHDLVQVAPSAEDVSEGLPGYALDLPGSPLNPGCDYEKWADGQWSGTEPIIYAHVATQSGVTDRFALQFYFFYPFNDYNNKHETDWERIQLEFPVADATQALAEDTQPDVVVFSQHYGAERAVWGDDKLEVEGDTHPVVYVSAGSHANQYSPGVFMGNTAATGFGCDITVGDHDAVHAAVKTIPSDEEEAAAAFPWTTYEGHWGEVGPKRFYEGPTGPNRKSGWTKPFSWSAGARDASVVVPGSGVAGSRAAEVYCDTVGAGSDAFRKFVDEPAATLGIGAAILAVVLWLLRRTEWHSDPLPLRQDRRSGQVVRASLGMLRRHWAVFLLLSLPMALLLVLAAVLQTLALISPVPGWASGPVLLLGLATMVVSGGAMTLAVSHLGRGERPRLRDLYGESARRLTLGLPALIVAFLAVLLLAGTVILAPVALVLLAAWNLLVPVIVLEGRAGFRGLRRSLSLVRHALGTVVPVQLLSAVLATEVGALLAALLFIAVPLPFVVLNALPPLVLALLRPLVSVMSTYNYETALVRKEAADSAATPDPEPVAP